MDAVFKALASASRRRLLDSLKATNGQSLQQLCRELDMARQSVSKHLGVLEAANLVSTTWHGREKLHYLNPVPIRELADRWIRQYEHDRLDVLTDLRRTLEATTMGKPEFVYTIYIQTTPELLYKGLTDPGFIARYMGDTGPRSDWQVGSPVLWKSDPDGEFEDLDQRVLEAEPGQRLAYTWHPLQPLHRHLFDSDEDYEAARSERSRVTFDIEPAEDPEMGTKQTITHDDFDSHDSEMLRAVSKGWVMILSSLKTVLEGGNVLVDQRDDSSQR
jgi:uncharacterized protein YndB with AHSA1/START domain/DNA-binding transcriptional ArsR family regulator